MNTVKINNMILTPLRRDLCETVLTRLYNRINMSKYRYQMMTEKVHIQDVVNAKHMVSYHMHGFNFIMFLTSIDGKPYNCLISKKELKFYLNQVKLHEVKIYMFRMRFMKDNFYRDTIFDGKLIKTDDFRGKFMIYDTYYMSIIIN